MACGDWKERRIVRTGLSSSVAREASLDELVAGATRHGLTVLELCVGGRHGVSSALAEDASALDAVIKTMASANVTVSSYREFGGERAETLGALSRGLGATVLVDAAGPLAKRLVRADDLREAGARAAVVVRGATAADDAHTTARAGHLVAWDAAPSDEHLGMQAQAVLTACVTAGDDGGERATALCQVRLAGGGPESTLHEGRGIGELMARLALARYDGTVMLAPSSPTYHVLWDRWLGRHRGWGCGSHASDPSLVTLEQHVTIGGAV